MSRHTEGPWQSVSDDHDPYTIIGGIDGPDDGRMHFTEICIINEEAADAEANRRLIIAAPDMLKALEAAERAHQVHANCDDCMEGANDPASCEHCFKRWNEAYELRQAALAKMEAQRS